MQSIGSKQRGYLYASYTAVASNKSKPQIGLLLGHPLPHFSYGIHPRKYLIPWRGLQSHYSRHGTPSLSLIPIRVPPRARYRLSYVIHTAQSKQSVTTPASQRARAPHFSQCAKEPRAELSPAASDSCADLRSATLPAPAQGGIL